MTAFRAAEEDELFYGISESSNAVGEIADGFKLRALVRPELKATFSSCVKLLNSFRFFKAFDKLLASISYSSIYFSKLPILLISFFSRLVNSTVFYPIFFCKSCE